jgi:hypothetical protein
MPSIIHAVTRGLKGEILSPMLKEAEQLLAPQRPGLFSKLAEITEVTNFTKMPAQQMRSMLEGKQVSPLEIKNTLGEMEGVVSKSEVMDEIALKGTKLEDVVLGGSADDFAKWYKEQIKYAPEGDATHTPGEWLTLYNNSLGSTKRAPTSFDTYQEPGAVPGSYRELFVTAPSAGKPEAGKEWHRFLPPPEPYNLSSSIGFVKSGDWIDGHSAYSDIPNPIVRIRYNDREVNGKKILFIEEMQGPAGDTKWKVNRPGVTRFNTKQEAEKYLEEYKRYNSEDIEAGVEKVVEGEQGKMPPALQSRIYDIGVKRVLALAKEKGYDGVAWTTGEMQVKRYEGAIVKAVDRVSWKTWQNGEKQVILKYREHGDFACTVNTSGIVTDGPSSFVDQPVDKVLGDIVGPKIISEQNGYIDGLDIKIGGEGLKRVYDKTLPEKFKKYGKGEIRKINLSHKQDVYASTDLEPDIFGELEPAEGATKMGTEQRTMEVPYFPITKETPHRYPIYTLPPAVMAIIEALKEENR